MGFWKIACACAGCAAGAGICIMTGGAAAPLVGGLLVGGGGLGGFLIGDKVDKEEEEREKRLEQNQRYKDTKDELNTVINSNNQTKSQIENIVGKLNGEIPRQPNETDEYLNSQLSILTNNLKDGKSREDKLRDELNKLRKELGSGGSLMSLLGLDKLSYTDKIMIIAAIVLAIWLLKG